LVKKLNRINGDWLRNNFRILVSVICILQMSIPLVAELLCTLLEEKIASICSFTVAATCGKRDRCKKAASLPFIFKLRYQKLMLFV
jgi:hypothetical protein